ncbi:hypothetical protein MRX96_021811 [Rhipicephalus microplus]
MGTMAATKDIRTPVDMWALWPPLWPLWTYRRLWTYGHYGCHFGHMDTCGYMDTMGATLDIWTPMDIPALWTPLSARGRLWAYGHHGRHCGHMDAYVHMDTMDATVDV